MNEKNILSDIIKLFQEYLSGKIKSKDLIRRYENVITQEEFPWKSENPKIQKLDEFQDVLAFFVENSEWRKEDPNYYGEVELRNKVKIFFNYLQE